MGRFFRYLFLLRPGRLTNEPGESRVRVDTEPFRTEVSRDDVAGVLTAVLNEPRAARRLLYVGAGKDPIERAIAKAVAA